jgi:hypothetical protein
MQQNAMICGSKSFMLFSRSLSKLELLCRYIFEPQTCHVWGELLASNLQQQGIALGNQLPVSEMLQGNSLARAFRHAGTAASTSSRVNDRSPFLANIWHFIGAGAHAG